MKMVEAEASKRPLRRIHHRINGGQSLQTVDEFEGFPREFHCGSLHVDVCRKSSAGG